MNTPDTSPPASPATTVDTLPLPARLIEALRDGGEDVAEAIDLVTAATVPRVTRAQARAAAAPRRSARLAQRT